MHRLDGRSTPASPSNSGTWQAVPEHQPDFLIEDILDQKQTPECGRPSQGTSSPAGHATGHLDGRNAEGRPRAPAHRPGTPPGTSTAGTRKAVPGHQLTGQARHRAPRRPERDSGTPPIVVALSRQPAIAQKPVVTGSVAEWQITPHFSPILFLSFHFRSFFDFAKNHYSIYQPATPPLK